LAYPAGLACDKEHIVVADVVNSRVEMFDFEGNFKFEIDLKKHNFQPMKVTIDTIGNEILVLLERMLVTTPSMKNAFRLSKYSQYGRYIGSVGLDVLRSS